MDQVNAIVRLNMRRLDVPLETFHARQLHSFAAELVNVPADVTDVGLRVYRPSGGYYTAPCSPRPNGNWRVRIPALYFPDAGDARYEVFGRDAADDATALGEGRIEVSAFGRDATAEIAAGVVPVMTIPDEGGAQHRVVAVLADGEWTWRIDG